MKAIDIIKAMVYDSNLAECANVHEFNREYFVEGHEIEAWIKGVFGDLHIKTGEIEDGIYLTVWEVDANWIYPFNVNNTPDVILERDHPEEAGEDDQEVWLWRIE